MTIANMAIEAGGKAGLFEVDDKCREYVAARARAHAGSSIIPMRMPSISRSSRSTLPRSSRACPGRICPAIRIPLAESRHIAVDQAVIGSCTNGRIEDMRAAAEVLRGRTVAENVRCIVIPATQKVWLAVRRTRA